MSTLSINLKKRLLSGGVWAFSGKTLTSLSALAVSALLARLLSPEEMGAYFLAFSLVSVAVVIGQLGLSQIIVKLIAESMGTGKPERARQSILLVLGMTGVSAIIVAALTAFSVGEWIAVYIFHSVEMKKVVGLIAVWVVIIIFQQLIAEIFRGFHDIPFATIFGGLITSLVSTVLFFTLWMFKGHGDLGQIIALALLASASSVILSSFMLWKRIQILPKSSNVIGLREILVISWPLWITSLMLIVLTQVDLWMLGMFRSQEEVAIYGAAVKFMGLVVMPLVIVNLVLPPVIAEMYSQGKIKELEKTLRTTAAIAAAPSFVVLGLLVFFGGTVLEMIYGSFYRSGNYILIILSAGQIVNVWAGSCGLALMLTGHQFVMMVITICCGLWVIIFSWLLVPDYGGEGVAIAAASGMALQNLLMLFFAKKKTGVWTHARLFSIKELRESL